MTKKGSEWLLTRDGRLWLNRQGPSGELLERVEQWLQRGNVGPFFELALERILDVKSQVSTGGFQHGFHYGLPRTGLNKKSGVVGDL
jgi:hypothetical protein